MSDAKKSTRGGGGGELWGRSTTFCQKYGYSKGVPARCDEDCRKVRYPA